MTVSCLSGVVVGSSPQCALSRRREWLLPPSHSWVCNTTVQVEIFVRNNFCTLKNQWSVRILFLYSINGSESLCWYSVDAKLRLISTCKCCWVHFFNVSWKLNLENISAGLILVQKCSCMKLYKSKFRTKISSCVVQWIRDTESIRGQSTKYIHRGKWAANRHLLQSNTWRLHFVEQVRKNGDWVADWGEVEERARGYCLCFLCAGHASQHVSSCWEICDLLSNSGATCWYPR